MIDLSAYDPDYLFTRKEVEKITGLSPRSVIRAAELGLLQETRIGPLRRDAFRSAPRYTRDAIRAFVNSGYIRPRSRH